MGKTVLVVDDDPDIRATMKVALEDAGYEVVLAADAAAAPAPLRPRGIGERPCALSPRQAEIAGLIALGYTNPQIARLLGLATGTVARHVGHIRAKLGLRRRAQIAAASYPAPTPGPAPRVGTDRTSPASGR